MVSPPPAAAVIAGNHSLKGLAELRGVEMALSHKGAA